MFQGNLYKADGRPSGDRETSKIEVPVATLELHAKPKTKQSRRASQRKKANTGKSDIPTLSDDASCSADSSSIQGPEEGSPQQA